MKMVVTLVVLALALPAGAAAAPELNVPTEEVRGEATSPAGGAVGFTVSAYNVTGPPQRRERRPADFSCTWPQGDVLTGRGEKTFSNIFFPLGATTVTCSTGDSDKPLQKSFKVVIRDTTPPTLHVPQPLSLTATTTAGVPASDPRIVAFLAAASASDAVDQAPALRWDAPLVFPIGTTDVRFTAEDDAGNRTSALVKVTVGAMTPPPPAPAPPPLPPAPPPPPPPVDPVPPGTSPPPAPRPDTPPADVRAVTARAEADAVTLTWRTSGEDDLSGVEVARADRAGGRTVVWSGAGTRYVDRSVRRGVTYLYTITSVDIRGNRSAGVEQRVKVPLLGLLAPGARAQVTRPPVLEWTPVARATYYNVQLWRRGKKVLSTWPSKPRLALKARWTHAGRTVRLARGEYRWYVWPGFGRRANAKYGKLLGTRTFTVRP